jgi:hypothetical protein
VKVDFMHFIVFAMYYVLVKAVFLLLNLEFRRANIHPPAAVAGLLS